MPRNIVRSPLVSLGLTAFVAGCVQTDSSLENNINKLDIDPELLAPYAELLPDESDDELYNLTQSEISLSYIADVTSIIDHNGDQVFYSAGAIKYLEGQTPDPILVEDLLLLTDIYGQNIFPTDLTLALYLNGYKKRGYETTERLVDELRLKHSPTEEGFLRSHEIYGYLMDSTVFPNKEQYNSIGIYGASDHNGAIYHPDSLETLSKTLVGDSAVYFVDNEDALLEVVSKHTGSTRIVFAGHGSGPSLQLRGDSYFHEEIEEEYFDITDTEIFDVLSTYSPDTEVVLFSCYAAREPTPKQEELGYHSSLAMRIFDASLHEVQASEKSISRSNLRMSTDRKSIWFDVYDPIDFSAYIENKTITTEDTDCSKTYWLCD